MTIAQKLVEDSKSNLEINLLSIQKYILCVLPFALVTGPVIPEIICLVSSVIFLILVIKNREWKYLYNPISIILFLWSLFLIISSFFSANILFSLESSLFYWRHSLFALSVWYQLDKNSEFKLLFLYSLTAIFFILICDGYFQFFSGENILGYPYYESKARLSSLFGDELRLGNYLSRLMPLLFALALASISKPRNYLILLCIFLISTDVLIYLSGERSAFGILIVTTIMMIIFLTNFKKFRIITFATSIIIILIITFFNDKVRSRMIENTINQIDVTNQNYIADHELFFTTSSRMFLDNPIVGIGPKMYRIKCSEEKYIASSELYSSCSTHPHFTYLQIISETGIIGLLFIVSIFIFISVLLLKHLFKLLYNKKGMISDEQICLFIALFITVFPLIPSNSFFNNWISIIYYLPLGFLLNTYSSEIKNYLKYEK